MGFRESLRPQRDLLTAVTISERLTDVGRFFVPLTAASVPVVRADDLVVLSITWEGLELAVEDGVAVLRDGDGRGGVLVAHFQPQHIDEEAIFEVATESPEILPKVEETGTTPPPAGFPDETTIAQSRLSAPSRLAFTVPVGWGPIAYTVEGILDALGNLPLRVHPGALPRQGPSFADRSPRLGGILGEIGQVLRHPNIAISRQPAFPPVGPDLGPPTFALAQTVGRRLIDAQRPLSDVPASQRLITRQAVQSFAVRSDLTGAAGAIEWPGRGFAELAPGLAGLAFGL